MDKRVKKYNNINALYKTIINTPKRKRNLFKMSGQVICILIKTGKKLIMLLIKK